MTTAEVLKSVPRSLNETCMLVVLTITCWSGRRLDRRASQTVADEYGASSSDRAGRYNKCLVPPSAINAVAKPASALRQYHYQVTQPWLDSGARILKVDTYFEYVNKASDLTREMDAAADRFASEYPAHVRNAQRELGRLFDPAEYPSIRDVRKRFGAELQFLPFPAAADFRVPDLDGHADMIRHSINAATERAIQNALAEVAQRVQDVAHRMAERLAAYQVKDDKVIAPFRDSLVQNVRELVDVIPALNIAEDPRVETIRKQLAALATHDADHLRADAAAREATARKAEALVKRMADYL